MDNTSGVGVLDKAVSVLAAVESGPATLAQLVAATGLARPTTHRIAVALEHHRLLARDVQGRFILGPRVAERGYRPPDVAYCLQAGQLPLDTGNQHCFLVAEVVEEPARTGSQAGGALDLRHRRGVVAAIAEQPHRLVEQAVASRS